MENLQGLVAPARGTGGFWPKPCAMALAVALALGLSGCGGGGGGGSANVRPTPPPPVGDMGFTGGKIDVGGNDVTVLSEDIGGSIDLIKGGTGTLVLTGTDTYTGGTKINLGTLQIGNGGTTGSITGDVIDNGSLVFNRSDNVAFNGIVSGSGMLTQAGKGTLTLTGVNSYAGATQVNTGSLYVDGDQSAATGTTTVANGALLGGKGILGGNLNVADGATLAPGSNGAIGTLTINGNLRLSAGSMLDYTFGQANTVGDQFNDLINVNGDLVLGGTINVSSAQAGSFGPGSYRVFNYTGTLTNNGLALGNTPFSGVLVQTGVAQQVNLINTEGMAFGFWDGDTGPKDNNAINGGSGTWESGSPPSKNWTDASGAVNTPFSDRSFAVFQATPGTVTVDDGNGDVNVAGMQFASSGYVIQGDAVHLIGSTDDPARSIIRVGDGTTAGAGYKAIINSVLDGDSTLVKTDAGTLVLNGANTYTGGTTISGGTLQIGNGGTTGSITGDVTDNGSLVFDRSDDVTFNGVISGSGSLKQTGTGTLTLTGASTYTGGTTINNGTLQLGNDNQTGSLTGDVTNNGSLVFDPGDDLGYQGVISGSGALVKSGKGTLTLTGASTFTGGTTVFGGMLEIASGTLGTGTIMVNYNGYHDAILRLDRSALLSNHIVLNNGTLDNAGSLINGVDNAAVESGTGFATILNHDRGRIEGKNSGLMLAATYSVIKNSSGGIIKGGVLGVGLDSGGEISNDSIGSVIGSSDGIAIRISGASATVKNTGGGTITGGSTAIYLKNGGEITNGNGSTIKTTNTGGVCQETGGCSIFVPTSTDGLSRDLTLTNAGAIVGDVHLDTTAFNFATLWAGSSIQGDLDMGPNSRLTLQGNAGTVEYYSHAVTGKTTFAGLSKYGDGTWIIDNNELDSATVTGIVAGTLQVGNGGTEGSIGQNDIYLYSTLVFDRSDNVIFNGRILGGGGSLVQAGSGTLVLTGDYLSPSRLTIENGTLQLGNGGTTGMIYADVLNNGSLIFDHSDDVVLRGAVSGTGALTQDGSGTLTLTANNTYSGGTTINNGALLAMATVPGDVTVNVAGALDGYALSIPTPGVPRVAGNLSNAGKVSVHAGDSTVGGNYAQASTGTLAVSLGSKLDVAGSATLNGGTLEVTGADSGYVSNTHTNVLTATGGVTGTFDQLVKGTGVVFTATTINYDANSVWLDTSGLNVTTAAAGQGVSYTPASFGSAQRVQGAFEQLDDKIAAGNLSDVSGDFLRAAGQFQQSPSLLAAQASLQSLSGELHAASAALTFQAIDASSRALSDRFDNLLDKGTGFGMWMRNLSIGGDMARAGFDGVGFQLNGWLVGSDRQIGHSGVAGYAFGQSRGQQRLNQSFDHDNSRSTEGMMYAGWLNGNWYTQGRVGFGHFEQDVSRQILLGDSVQGVRTQYNGNYNVAYGESGLHFGRGDSHVTPFVNVQYARIDRGGFAEQGAGGFGLRSNAQTLDRWQAGLGVRAGRHWNLDSGRAVDFSARAQWQRTLASHGDVFNASFVGLEQWQPLVGIGLSRYSGLLGVGLDATLSAHTTLKFGYDYEMGQRDKAQMLSARLNVAF